MAQQEFEMQTAEGTRESQEAPVLPKNRSRRRASDHSSVTVREPITAKLKHTNYPFFIFIIYAVLALLAWIFTCILSRRPIWGTKSYFEPIGYAKGRTPEIIYSKNRTYVTAAQVLRVIVALLTVPVTSALCSMAAVVYMQAGSMRRALSLRQLMGLADQGWTSPRIALDIRAASIPLWFAVILTVIGKYSVMLPHIF